MVFDDFVVKNYGRVYWDEWNFYLSNENLSVARQLAENITEGLGKSTVLCSLSKSGLPLASAISLITKMPLVLFTIGEFFEESGSPIIGTMYGESFRDCHWNLIDSHIHSGQTAMLAESAIKSQLSGNVDGVYVVADCTKKLTKNLPFRVISQIGEEETWERLKKILKDKYGEPPDRLGEQNFWFFHPKSWLASLPPESGSVFEPAESSVEVRVQKLDLGMESTVCDPGGRVVKPQQILLQPELLHEYVSAISEKATGVDTVIACSVGGLALASALSFQLTSSGITHTFLFLGNNPIEHYKKILSDRGAKSAILVDDVVSSGSVVATVNKILLEPSAVELAAIACIAKTNFPTKGNYLHCGDDGVPLYCGLGR